MKYVSKLNEFDKVEIVIDRDLNNNIVSFAELNGILELCKIYGKDIELVNQNNTIVFKKN